MSVSQDMVRSWRRPRAVMRDKLAQGRREDRAIAYLMIACLLVFVSRAPFLSRQAAGFNVAPGQEPRDLTEMLSYELFAWLMLWPLVFYGLAGLIHLIARVFGGRGSFYTARLALFWSFLASTPALLLYGLTTGFVGPGPQAQLVGAIWVAGFLWILIGSLREAEAAP